MKKTDLLVIPSRSEGDGLVVIEAILRNIPLIIADIPEFRRFNFPDVNYASEVTDFSASITGNFMNASIFQVNSVITHEIAKHRDIENIARSWEDLFREMNLPK
jgi:glycosyltransferase involved in cell wall biosynthesis